VQEGQQNKSADQHGDGHPEMDVRENAPEPAWLWQTVFRLHGVLCRDRSAAMLGQFSRLIQSNETGVRQFRLDAHIRVQNSVVEILSDKAGICDRPGWKTPDLTMTRFSGVFVIGARRRR
jgi:hypothetical protein